MTLSTISNTSTETIEKRKQRFFISRKFVTTSILCLIGWILLLISFASPYWLTSIPSTYSNFIRLGLWDFCFKNFRHPQYHYDEIFSGCYWIYSPKYHNIRDWLQPNWFVWVQAMITIAFVFSLLSLTLIAISLMYFLIRYHVVIIAVLSVLQSATALTALLGAFVFWLKHDDRDWLLNPNFNQLDWSYYLVLIVILLHFLTGYLMLKEAFYEHQRRRRMNNLVYNMQSRNPKILSHETRPMMTKESQYSFQPHFTQV